MSKLVGGCLLLAVAIAAGATASDADSQPTSLQRAPTFVEAGCATELRAKAEQRWPGGSYNLDNSDDEAAFREGSEAALDDESVRVGFGTDEEAALEFETDRVGAEASQRWPGSFAGAWGEQPASDRFNIAFTEGAADKVAQLAEGHPCPDLLSPVTAEYSMEELEARQGEMITDRELIRQGSFSLAGVPGHHYDLDIDDAHNAIVVTVEEATAEAVAAFKARYGDDVIVEEGEPGRPE